MKDYYPESTDIIICLWEVWAASTVCYLWSWTFVCILILLNVSLIKWIVTVVMLELMGIACMNCHCFIFFPKKFRWLLLWFNDQTVSTTLIPGAWQIPRTGYCFPGGRLGFVGGLGSRVFKFIFSYRSSARVRSLVVRYIPIFFIFIISNFAGCSPNGSTFMKSA